MTARPAQEDSTEALAADLTRARQRGLADLDLRVGQQMPVELPILEPLARRYTESETGSRSPLIRRLLEDSLKAYAEQAAPAADFVRALFFDDQGRAPGPSRAGGLLDAAMRASGITNDDNFRKRRRREFVDFADFLIKFVERAYPAAVGRHRWWLVAGGATLLAAAIGVTALTWPEGTRPQASSTTSRSKTPSSSPGQPIVMLRFDSLGSRASNIISVYPGVTTSSRDRTASGQFSDGDTVVAICVITGRRVTSDPAYGEDARSSTRWVQIDDTTPKKEYATLTYADLIPSDAALPDCL